MSSLVADAALIEITTTTASQADARQLAARLLQQRLAACVQIARIESHYRWQGALQQTPEWQLLIKSRQDRFQAIARLLEQEHPYELPQLLATAIRASSPGYAAWLHAQLDE